MRNQGTLLGLQPPYVLISASELGSDYVSAASLPGLGGRGGRRPGPVPKLSICFGVDLKTSIRQVANQTPRIDVETLRTALSTKDAPHVISDRNFIMSGPISKIGWGIGSGALRVLL